MPLLSPQMLMTIKDLHLAAKTVVEGLMTGGHRSGVKGEGLEFSQYRSYQPGDDLRMLDWKLFARSDRYYIREAETERNVSVQLLVDTSASMNHADSGYTKLEYARYLTAALAYIANRQGDTVGLTALQADGMQHLPARNGNQHMARLYYQLEKLRAEGRFTNASHLQKGLHFAAKKELVVFITDYYEQTNEISQMLAGMATQHREIMVLHLMAQNEMEADYKGYTAVEDWETGQVIKIDPQQAAKLYQQRLKTHLEGIRTILLAKNIFYKQIQTDEPPEMALREFLRLRNNLKL